MAAKPKYRSSKQLEACILQYFAALGDKMPTKAGLRLHLDISRDTYSDYRKSKLMGDTIKKADSKIEEAWIQRLNKPQATGAIFYLKNAYADDYRERQELTGKDGGALSIVALPPELIAKHGLKDTKATEEK